MTTRGGSGYNYSMENTGSPAVGRFAPTPSGRMHLGNIFTALIAMLSARSKGGKLLLRIEDLDRERCPRDAEKLILDDLDWFGIEFDGEPVRQSERTDLYRAELGKLERAGLLYPCFCSRAELHASTAPHGSTPVYGGKCRALPPELRPARPAAMRVIVPNETITFTDAAMGTCSENLLRECGDFIVRRSDGIFAYQLAVVADDAATGVTEVVRGRDLLSSTPRQIWLHRTLGYTPPFFTHVPLVLDANGNRLSKRDGTGCLSVLREKYRSSEPLIGVLAAAAGILPRPEPVSARDLIPLYSPTLLPRSDILLPPL